jgi:hypothetical protein
MTQSHSKQHHEPHGDGNEYDRKFHHNCDRDRREYDADITSNLKRASPFHLSHRFLS